MSSASPLPNLNWVQTFFSGRNQLRWESIETQTALPKALAHVTPWLKKLTAVGDGEPVVLPLYAVDGQITWYAMAADDRHFGRMVDEITGYVGPSYSDFRGEWAQLSMDDAQERALAERFGPRVIKFKATLGTDQADIENALTLYLSVLTRRPDTPDRSHRPFGKVRADFDRAVLAGNSPGAQALLEELLASGRLNAEQRKCLEIRLLAGLGRTAELAKKPALIASVSDLPLPAQTLVDIVTALYETFIGPLESDIDHISVIDAFKRHIHKPFGALFRERKGLRQPIVLRAFLLSELAAREPNVDRCRSILAAYPKSAEGYDLALAWCKGLNYPTSQAHEDQTAVCLNHAKQSIADEDYETASVRCFELLPLPWAYSALLRCAAELGAPDLTQRVLDVLASAPRAIHAGLSDKDRTRLDTLRGSPKSTTVAVKLGWVAWAEHILATPLTAPSVVELQELAAKWSIDDYATDTQRCETFAHLIGKASGDAENVFRDAFSVLVDFFTEGGFGARRAFKAIYSNLIKVLGWSGSLSSDELEIGAQLIQALLTTGPSAHEYAEALADLQEILKANASPAHFDWGLNVAELVVQYPAPDGGGLRLRLFLDVVGMLRAAPHRITVPQRDILTALSCDYGCPSLLDTFPSVSIAQEAPASAGALFAGLIGIYTLTEGAGQRAKEILERMYPHATVEINSDSVSTDRLTSLAKAADIFVFAWKSSKHQAYFCVKEARQGQDIILPLGKGSASILSGVLEKISSITMR